MIGFVFATEMEAAPFLEATGAVKIADEPIPLYRFDHSGVPVEGTIAVSGMGPEAGARAAGILIDEHGATEVVNAGVCATAVEEFAVGALFRVTEIREWREDEAGRSLHCSAERWSDLAAGRLATVAEPVHDRSLRERISRYAELIDMEGYAVARLCDGRGIGVHLIKGVTDSADERTGEAIRTNIAAVSEKIASTLLDGLRSGPARSPNPRLTLGGFLQFTKVEHTVFSLPLLFAGAWLGAGERFPSLTDLVLIALAGVGARILGMSMNRILDERIDARNPRTAGRELPSGKMARAHAILIASAGLAVYLVACALLGRICLLLSPVPALVLILYSLLKRFTSLCHFGIGLCLCLAPLGAYVATSGGIDFGLEIILLSVFTFFWISGYDVIYALQDIESDRRSGVNSLPALLGPAGAQTAAAISHLGALGALAWLAVTTSGGILAWIAFTISISAMVLAYAPWIPLPARFFPLSAIAGIAGSVVPLLGGKL